MKKPFLVLIIILVFLSGGFLFWQTKNSRQTYQNKTHQFSFSYPKDWRLVPVNESKESLGLKIIKEDTSQKKIQVYQEEMTPLYEIIVSVEENANNLSPKDFHLRTYLEEARKKEEERLKEITIAGYPAIEYTEGVGPASGPATAILVTLNKKAYRFIYSAVAPKETHEKYLGVFRNLLTTIKFFK